MILMPELDYAPTFVQGSTSPRQGLTKHRPRHGDDLRPLHHARTELRLIDVILLFTKEGFIFAAKPHCPLAPNDLHLSHLSFLKTNEAIHGRPYDCGDQQALTPTKPGMVDLCGGRIADPQGSDYTFFDSLSLFLIDWALWPC